MADSSVPTAVPDVAAERADAAADLHDLALACGIEPAFVDARGVTRETSAATERALLAALGVDAATPEAVRIALDARRSAPWATALPPVVVAESAGFAVPIALAAQTAEVAWRVTLEDGTKRSGRVRFGDLETAESAAERGGVRIERRVLPLPDLPPGYHDLRLDGIDAPSRLIVSPGSCWLPPDVADGARLGGIAIQLYLLRSATNWGIGDFTDLRAFAAFAAARGLDVVGLNPLHAMHLDEPERASPYSPASRLLLNALNIDVTAVPEFERSLRAQARVRTPDFVAALEAARAAHLVEYETVAERKMAALRDVFADFDAAATPERQADFARFRAAASPMRERTYLFIALRDWFAARGEGRAAWQSWPAAYREATSGAVAAFAREHAAAVTFAAWLDWIADEQLAAAAAAAGPMRAGFYRDLAVGADPGGAETWVNARAVIQGARIGAPPDIYNPAGQNWDLPPFDPAALRAEAYASFIDLLRANMRHAGALRIDHVMALEHLYLIPRDATPDAGAYVRYPLDDLCGIIALESRRARCAVVGEDLGTVPAGFRERMARAGILSYRVLFFERDASGAFNPPDAYPRGALAVLGSHDLPTLAAWWNGADIRLRERVGLLDDDGGAVQRRARAADREAFTAALQAAEVLAPGAAADAATLFTAAHAFLARTPAMLAIAQLDDITGEIEPVNVPTTSDEHPNWRRRFALTVEEIAASPRLAALLDVFAAAGRVRGT